LNPASSRSRMSSTNTACIFRWQVLLS